MVSAITAAAFSTAHADISVSGSAGVSYHSAGSNTEVVHGGAVSFALSTTTDSGMTISSSAGITNDIDGDGGGNYRYDFNYFSAGGTTISIGDDIGATDGTGEVGDIVAQADFLANGPTTSVGIGDHEGSGVSLTTGLGDASLTAVYVYDGGGAGDLDGAANTATSVKISMPMGPMSVAGSYASSDIGGTVDNESAISASYRCRWNFNSWLCIF